MTVTQTGFKHDPARKKKHPSDIEEKKWEFKRQELIYLEAGQHLRSLNGFLWQVPGLAIAITGGIWYGTTNLQTDNDLPKIFALTFVGIFNVLTIVVIWRLRKLINIQIKEQRDFAKDDAKRPVQYWVVGCWSIQLLCAAVFSFAAAIFPEYLKKTEAVKSQSVADFRLLMDSQKTLQNQVNFLMQNKATSSCCCSTKTGGAISSKTIAKSEHKPKRIDPTCIDEEKK